MLCLSFAFFTQDSAAQALSAHERASIIGGFPLANPSPAARQIQGGGQWNRQHGLQAIWERVGNAGDGLINLSLARRTGPIGAFQPSGRDIMTQFFAENLGGASANTRHLLYFFGGPDAIYPLILFPNLERAILVGMEPPGELLDPAALAARGALTGTMQSVTRAFRDILRESYYITANMHTDLQAFGTTTMMSVGLVAMGATIIDVSPVSLDRSGILTEGREGRVKGSRIRFRKVNGQNAEMIYFQKNLSDSGMQAEPEFRAFIEREPFETAYFKAASFLPHSAVFSQAVRLVLSKINYLVQADNGIPLRELRREASQWAVKIWGIYARPAPGFTAATVQEDLKLAMQVGICTRGTDRQRDIFRRLWNIGCAGQSSESLGFHSLEWQGILPFHYDYSAFSGGREVVAQPERRTLGNLIYAERIR